ncbi:MAG: hypothetical protein U5K76_07470 [Woeseiaceae bacterium]|nr:hypothetical protein [Woeseiaceae bacterium]
MSRKAQLRRAKRAQRERERRAGLVNVQLLLPQPVADKLKSIRGLPGFAEQLDTALDRVVLRIRDYPQLSDLAWNRTDEFIPANEAFRLYERNWRFVELDRLDGRERKLIDRLASEYGGGVINA